MSISGSQIVDKARSQMKKKDGPRPGRYSGDGRPWCSEFVSWVYKEAGYPFGKFTWLLKSTNQIIDWFSDSSTYIQRDDPDWDKFTPTPGDYVFIGRAGDPDREHSGIMDYIDDDGGLHTIEGNNRAGTRAGARAGTRAGTRAGARAGAGAGAGAAASDERRADL